MKTLILNDLHFGCSRQAGATEASRLAMEHWMLERFKKLLEIPHDDLIILGDLCDKRNIPEHLMLQIIELLKNEKAIVVLGNHCYEGSFVDTTLSSCEFISRLSNSVVVKDPTWDKDIYIIPHLFNQADHEEVVKKCPDNYIMLTHCNIDSNFAVGDHSLNLSKKEILELEARGVRVLAAHEHHARKYHNVEVIGNQFPTSIADCLGGDKRAAIIEDGEISFVETWKAEDDYIELHHTDIKLTDHKFVRINGECTMDEYRGIEKRIAELRRNSNAFVVSNNVKVQVKEHDSLTAEEVTAFNILGLLLKSVPEEFREEARECI